MLFYPSMAHGLRLLILSSLIVSYCNPCFCCSFQASRPYSSRGRLCLLPLQSNPGKRSLQTLKQIDPPEDPAGPAGATAVAATAAVSTVLPTPSLASSSRGRFLEAGASLAAGDASDFIWVAGFVSGSDSVAAVFSAFETSTLSAGFCISQDHKKARVFVDRCQGKAFYAWVGQGFGALQTTGAFCLHRDETVGRWRTTSGYRNPRK